MNPELLKEYLKAIVESGIENPNLHFHFYPEFELVVEEEETGELPVEVKPGTDLIEVTDGEAYKIVSYFNDARLPVMTNAKVGWKSEVGFRYEVYADFVQGDGGERYWKIYKGPSHLKDAEQLATRGYYLTKSKTRKV